MRARLAEGAGGELGAEARADADLFTAVALALLKRRARRPRRGAPDAAAIDELVAGAEAHEGAGGVRLFGSEPDHGLLAVRAPRPLRRRAPPSSRATSAA